MRLQAYVYLGWSPILAVASDGSRRVLEVSGWEGGSGTAPATGLYLGSDGYVTNVTDGVDIAGGGAGGGGVDIQVGTRIITNGTAVFSNGNGVTFGAVGNTITASVQTNYQSSGNYLTTAMQSNAGTDFLSVSQSSLFQQTSLMSNYQPSGAYLTTAMQSNAGSNFLSVSQSSLFQQTSLMSNYQTTGNYLTTAMRSDAGSNFAGLGSAITNGTMTYNSQGLSLNLSNHLTTAMQSNAGSNFLSVSQSSLFQQTSLMSNYAGTGTTFAGTNISGSMTLNSNGLNLALSGAAGGGGGGSINFSAGTTSNNLAAITFSNANGVSFGLNGSVMTGSVAAAGGAQTGISGISAGTTVLTNGTLSFGNGSGVTFGLNGSVLTATVATNYQSQGAYLTTAMASNAGSNFVGLNTAITNGAMTANSSGISINLSNLLTTAMLSNQSTNFAGLGTTFNGANISGSITLNTAGLNLSLSAASGGGGGITNINVSAGTTSNNLSAVTFSNSNGVSFGLNGSVVTATVATNYQSQGAYLTTAMQSNAATISNINLSAGTTSSNISAFVFSNSNNVSFGLTNGSQITASASFAAQTVQPMYYSASGTSSSSGTLQFGNTNGISFSLSNGSIVGTVATNYQSQGAYLTTAMVSNAGSNFVGLNTAGTNATFTLNSSGFSFNGGAYLTTAMASNAGSNFAGVGSAITNGTMTYGSNGLSLNLSNHLTTAMASNAGSNFVGLNSAVTGASLTVNSSGISINVPAAAPSPVYVIAGTTNGSLGTISFANSNGVSFGLNGSTITASAAGGGGGGIVLANSQTTYTSGTANMIASGALTIGSTTGQSFYFSAPAQSSLSATGQVSISVNGSTISIGVPNGIILSEYAPYPLGANTTFSSAGQSSIYLQKIQPAANFSFSVIERWASLSFASSTNNASVNYSIQYGVYSRDLGASSTRMTQMGSSQMDIRVGFSSNTSMAASIVVGANTVATGSAGTVLYSNITAGKHIYFPYATSLAGGNEYWIAFNVLSASTGTSTPLRIALLELTNINNLTWGKIKSDNFFATNASYVDDFSQGVFTVQSAALPVTIADSQVSNQVSLGRQYLQFDNN